MYSRDRAVRTAFSDALKELIRTKKLKDITVREIAARAGLSHMTFYRHFRDKYELAMWNFYEMFRESGRIALEEGTPDSLDRENLHRQLVFIRENREYFLEILQYEGQNSFREYFLELSIQLAREQLREQGIEMAPKLKYQIRYHSSGQFSVIEAWLRSEDGLSIDDLVDVITSDRHSVTVAMFGSERESESKEKRSHE